MTLSAEVRQSHPYYMHDAILRQPEAMAEMLRKHTDLAPEAAAILANKRRIYLVGIGTSWHAVLVAEHWFRRFSADAAVPGPEIQGWHSFEFCAYSPPLSPEDAVIVISHRGTKAYSFMALELAKERGAYTIAVTSTNPGPRLKDPNLELKTVEPEVSAAFTVSYTAALTTLAMVAAELGKILGGGAITLDGADGSALRLALEQTPNAVAQVIDRRQDIQLTVQRFAERQRFLSVGWGPNTANAYEVALKIKETSAADCEGLQLEQLLHGPFCSLDAQCLLTLIAPPGPGYQRALDVARASVAAETTTWALVEEGDAGLAGLATDSFALPPLPEVWTPLAYVAPLQLFTYYLALARGKHPDRFQQDNPRQAAAKVHYEL